MDVKFLRIYKVNQTNTSNLILYNYRVSENLMSCSIHNIIFYHLIKHLMKTLYKTLRLYNSCIYYFVGCGFIFAREGKGGIMGGNQEEKSFYRQVIYKMLSVPESLLWEVVLHSGKNVGILLRPRWVQRRLQLSNWVFEQHI